MRGELDVVMERDEASDCVASVLALRGPPYSPEFNPDEQVWAEVKAAVLSQPMTTEGEC